jgi:hypothetical protein
MYLNGIKKCLSELSCLIKKFMFLGSNNAQLHKLLMNVNLIIHVAWYVNRHICKSHRIFNRDINIWPFLQSHVKRIHFDIREKSSEGNERDCACYARRQKLCKRWQTPSKSITNVHLVNIRCTLWNNFKEPSRTETGFGLEIKITQGGRQNSPHHFEGEKTVPKYLGMNWRRFFYLRWLIIWKNYNFT